MILSDRHQRDKKTGNKEGIQMTTTQSALNIGNQNEMISLSYHDAGILPSCTLRECYADFFSLMVALQISTFLDPCFVRL